MLTALKLFAGKVLKALLPFLPWIAVGIVGAVLWHHTPVVGPRAELAKVSAERDQWRTSASDWRRAAGGWKASFEKAEGLRRRESATAQAAATSLIQQCSARVAEARASARVIERIVTKEPTYDENRCPVRERVDPGQLRDALAPGSRPD